MWCLSYNIWDKNIFISRIDLTCNVRRWHRSRLGLANSYNILAFTCWPIFPRPNLKLKKKEFLFFFTDAFCNDYSVISFYFQNKSLVVEKWCFPKKTHDKDAADVYIVPRLKTSIAPVVSVVFLPRRHEWTEVKTKQSSPLSSLSVWGLVWGVICNPIQSNHKWRTENTTSSSSLQNHSSHPSLP